MPLKPTRSVPAAGPVFQSYSARTADVMGTPVRRVLPQPRRRTVGAWCFLDHFGPALVPAGRPRMGVGPHPHCGLATVTWLLSGDVLHRDSLGTAQPIRPGQLNWMTSGRGISHAEEGEPTHQDTRMHGVQLWVALPDATRNGPPRFEHYALLPREQAPGLDLQVLVGAFGGVRSPAQADTPLFGFDVALTEGVHELPLEPEFETAVVVVDGAVRIEGALVEPGTLVYLGTRRSRLRLEGVPRGRAMVLGGEPLNEDLLMAWNFVVRSPEELDAAFLSWESDDGRFGRVEGARAARIPAPPRR